MTDNKIYELLRVSEKIGDDALAEAAQTDSVDSFPVKALENAKKAGLLDACVSAKYGGLGLGLKPFTNFSLLSLLKNVGSGNLVMGRVLEGHINAQLLIDQFGDEDQKAKFSLDASAGKLFGVWNTQADDGTFLTPDRGGHYVLNGSKTFATGSGYVTRPVVTATLPDGSWQMCVVNLDEIQPQTEADWWHPMGMRSSRSYKMIFKDILIPKTNMLGAANIYYSQPAFSGGAIRFAAVQLGAAERLLDETRKYLQSLGRTDDPYQRMRLGEMTIAVTSGNQWMKSAAQQLDRYLLDPSEENSQKFLSHANMMRTAIERICSEVMNLCQKCVGARGLNKPYHFERIIRDLGTYLRQPAPDATLADVGRVVLQTPVPFRELWPDDSPENF